jgi:hypothetical protein
MDSEAGPALALICSLLPQRDKRDGRYRRLERAVLNRITQQTGRT